MEMKRAMKKDRKEISIFDAEKDEEMGYKATLPTITVNIPMESMQSITKPEKPKETKKRPKRNNKNPKLKKWLKREKSKKRRNYKFLEDFAESPKHRPRKSNVSMLKKSLKEENLQVSEFVFDFGQREAKAIILAFFYEHRNNKIPSFYYDQNREDKEKFVKIRERPMSGRRKSSKRKNGVTREKKG
jgi:hypothetical protein